MTFFLFHSVQAHVPLTDKLTHHIHSPHAHTEHTYACSHMLNTFNKSVGMPPTKH